MKALVVIAQFVYITFMTFFAYFVWSQGHWFWSVIILLMALNGTSVRIRGFDDGEN